MTGNFALNPSFEGVAGSFEVARNYHVNPGAVPGRGGYGRFTGGGNTQVAAYVESSWPSSGWAYRATWTDVADAAEGSVQLLLYAPDQTTLTPGETYTVVSRTVVSRTGISLNPPLTFATSSVPRVAWSRSTSITPEAGEIVTDWTTFVCPEHTAGSNLKLTIVVGSKESGDWVEISMTDIYQGEYRPERMWFSDAYSPDPDLVPSLSGTASVLRVTGVSGVNAGGAANGWSIASSQWASSGSMSARNYRPALGTTDSYVGVTSSWFPDFGPGKVYGVKAKVRLAAPLSGTTVGPSQQATRLRRFMAVFGGAGEFGSPDQYPNETGVHEIQWVFTVPEGATGLTAFRVYSGHSFGDHWVDDVLVAPADTEAEAQALLADTFFWGDSPTETRPDGYTRRSWWEGTTNNSISVRGEWEPGVLSGWIAAHTGMPSLRVTVPGPVYAGDRLLVNPSQLPALVSDPLAPPGVPIVYRQGEHQVTLTRPDTGFHMVTDRDGRTGVRIALLGDDATDQGTGVAFFEPDSGHGDIPQWGRIPAARGTLSCRTAGEDTARLLALIRARTPLVSLHSARACQVPECDIPPARGFIAGSARYARDGVVTQARRVWEIPWTGYSLAGRSAPVVTWGEYEAHSDGWSDESYEELCRRVAGMP